MDICPAATYLDIRLIDPPRGVDPLRKSVPTLLELGDVPPAAEFNDVGVEGPLAVNKIPVDRLCHFAPPADGRLARASVDPKEPAIVLSISSYPHRYK